MENIIAHKIDLHQDFNAKRDLLRYPASLTRLRNSTNLLASERNFPKIKRKVAQEKVYSQEESKSPTLDRTYDHSNKSRTPLCSTI